MKKLKGHRKTFSDGREVHIALDKGGIIRLQFIHPQGRAKITTELALSNEGAGALLGLLMYYAAEGKIVPPRAGKKP